jgi:DNA-binding transcriptional LysR family regulator
MLIDRKQFISSLIAVELSHLQSFLAVYRNGNITRAAEELHISQPAITSHLRSLESELKRPLFVRLPRGVAATPLGDQLASEITGPLDSLSVTSQSFRPDAPLGAATLILGGPADLLSAVVLPSLAPLASHGLSIRVRTGLTDELIRALANSEIDVALATTPTRHRSVTLTPFFDETLALVVSSQLAASLGRTTDLRNIKPESLIQLLADHPLIAFAEDAPLVRRYWRTAFGKSAAPNPRIVVDDLRAIANAIASSFGWSVLPTYLIKRELARGELVVPWQPATPPINSLYIATRATRNRQPYLDRVVEHLQNLATQYR